MVAVLLLFCAAISVSAQINEQRVFLWDVSHSLIKSGLEQPLKNALISSIDAIEENGTDRIVLVPFYNEPLEVIDVEATKEGKKKLIEEINKRDIKKSQVSNTSITGAINKFHELLKPGYRNYMFLYTDGKNENAAQHTDMDPLVKLLKDWGVKTADKNCYGFYVLVNKAAEFPELYEVEKENDNFFVVKDANVRIKILNLPPISVFNSRNEDVLWIPVNGDLKHIGKEVRVECQDSVYSVESGGLRIGPDGKNGVLEVMLTPLKEGPLPEVHTLNIKPVITGADAYTFITPKNPKIRIKYTKERTMSLTHEGSESNEKADLGECTYYPSFLWSEEKRGEVCVNFKMEFNKDSKDYDSQAILLITDDEHKPLNLDNYEVIVNGKLLSKPAILVDADQTEMDLCIRPLPSAPDGKTKGYIMLMPGHTLDRVNQTEVENSREPVELVQWKMKFHNNMNPWAKWLLIALIIAAALLLLWLILLRPLVYPRIRKASRITISDPYFANRKIKGAYKVVCTSRNRKQGWVSRLFKGKEIYEVNPVWTSDLVFTASKRGVRLSPNSTYEIDPYSSTLMKNMDYKIKNTENKEKITLTIM